MSESTPIGGKIVTKPFLVLAGLVLFAIFLAIIRYGFGLGSVTHLSDGYPWGIWIAYDVVVGTAIACGGYSMALLVYVANKRKYHPLVRPALMASMFGYSLAGISVFIDIGRYWNGYNLFLPWYANVNSIMLEVALCIATYVLVLWIEFAPSILEGYRESITPLIEKYKRFVPSFLQKLEPEGLHKKLNKWIFAFIAVGVLLPTMHQSSLGTLMIISGRKLSPLWQTQFLPLLFLISAVTMGYAIVIFESVVSSVGFKRPAETPLLSKVSGVMAWLIGGYLVLRFADLIIRGQLGLAVRGDLQGNMFIFENLLYLAPVVLLANPANRTNPRWLFVSGASMLLAGSVYRFNTFLVGFNPGAGWHYFPAFAEIMITVGVIAFEIMMYILFVKKLPVLPKLEHA
jgi:Ni/Fe-hydrogenase subunit HybB-like protein